MTSSWKFTLSVVLAGLLVCLFLEGDNLRQEAFTYAVREGHTKTMKLLVWAGADANQSIEPTIHPLLCVTSNNDPEAVRFVLDHGADVNATASVGWTALMEAVERENLEIVRLLLSRGVNVNAVSDEGSALRLAAKKSNAAIVEVLKQHGANE